MADVDVFKRLHEIKHRKPRLLICGSRKATDEMLAFAAAATLRALDNGWEVIAGDADGVDDAVVKRHWQYIQGFTKDEAPRLWCFGVTPQARNSVSRAYYIPLPLIDDKDRIQAEKEGVWRKAFYLRDEVMAEWADGTLAVWNGFSGGTRHTFEYAMKIGKPVYVKDFKPQSTKLEK